MPESPSSSFIPKRGPGKKPASARKGNFVLFSIVSYSLFVSAPLASAAVFIYERHTQNQFNTAVVALDQAIVNFKEEDLKRVTDFNERLSLSKSLLSAHASINSLLTAIENSTAQTVKFKGIDITRKDKANLEVSGIVTTANFDGALFQRSTYTAADIISSPLFTDIKLVQAKAEDTKTASVPDRSVEFKVSFNFAVSDVPYKPFIQNSAAISPVESGSMSEQTPAEDTGVSSETSL